MAGNGPAPAENRRRRAAPARGDWVDLEALTEPVLPELPELDEGGWRTATFETWKAWREDPVTGEYSPADIAYAIDTIMLHQAMTPATANEVRLRMDALGLTPKGKRDLRWRIKPADVEELEAPAPKKAKRKKQLAKGDRRARLSVVK